ncbi:hypothetical protein NMG60_11027317 [Bertholletia excelsa]
MERHKCKLCSKVFANGRALGGHMRSHLANLPVPPKAQETETASSLSEEERESEEKGLGYGLRENPKRSFRVVDPEFLDAGLLVQDRESETESSKNPTRPRSKRTRKMVRPGSSESVAELEQASSVSDASPEEDVALCLMMLSRDSWSSGDSGELGPGPGPTPRKYRCETCNKVFGSFQALGGHRTSHGKMKSCTEDDHDKSQRGRIAGTGDGNANQKIHECPVCFRVFASGQALGGHKRSHLLVSSTSSSPPAKFEASVIDLNMPAPVEDDEVSQPEVSAVSDAEFVNPISLDPIRSL